MDVNSSTATRRYDLDQLKTFLTGLVIVHHTAIPYGGAGNWQFRSQLIGKDFLSQPLILFNGFNQSFSMGLFFWISGRMSAQALSKPKASTAGFLGARLVRLGIPTILNTIFGPPLVACLAQGRVGDIYQEYWRQLRGVKGVTWYTATLLTFDFVAASLQHLGQPTPRGVRGGLKKVSPSIYSTINRHGWLLTAVISFVIRLRFPVGVPLAPLGVQPAYLAQYIMAYTLGYMSLQQGDMRMTGPFEMRRIEKSGDRVAIGKENIGRVARRSLRLAATMSALTLPFCFLTSDGSFAWAGGWNLNAAAYALWNEWSFMLVGPALMDYFQAYHNKPTTSWLWQPRYTYVAFIVHPPLSVAIEVLLDKAIADKTAMSLFLATSSGSLLGPAMLTGFVGLVNAAAAFAAGRCLFWAFPVIKRIL